MQIAGIRPGVLLLALAIAFFLWGVANGSSDVEVGYDVPIVLQNTPEELVVTDQNVDEIYIKVRGSRAAQGNVSPNDLEYVLDIGGGKPGIADYEVNTSRINLPRGLKVSSRSPGRVQVRLEEKGRKVVNVRAELVGALPEGYRLANVNVVPRRVRLAGARSQVLRVEELSTDPIDLTGLQQSVERDVSVLLGGGTVWLEEDKPIKILLQIEPEEPPADVAEEGEVAEKESESG